MLMRLISNAKKYEIPATDPNAAIKKYVKVMRVVNDTNSITIEGTGRIIASRKIDITAEVQGQLLNAGITLKAGTTFRQGQILFSIKDTEARLALQARKSMFMNLLANTLPDIKLDFSESYGTWKNFFENIEPEKALPEIPVVKNSKERTFISAKNIYSEYYMIKAEEERLKKYFFAAPFDGTITDVFIETGAIVNPGTRIATIIKTEDLEMEMAVDANNITYIRLGQNAELYANGINQSITGKVIRVGSHINSQTQSIPIFIKIEDSKKMNLFNGMYLEAKINAGTINNCFKIPRRALNDKEVFLVEDSSLIKTNVDILFVGTEHVIVRGLKNNATLVAEPLSSNISEGNKVIPEFVK